MSEETYGPGSTFLITGISAAGKSTIGAALARRFELSVHIDGDVFFNMVVGGKAVMSSDPSDEAVRQLRLRYRNGAMVADTYARNGFVVVVQDVILGPFLEEYVGLIESRPLYVIVLAPRPDALVTREADRPKVAYRKDVESEIVETDAGFRTGTPKIGLWLDTSDQTVEETVDEILARAETEAAV